MIEKDKSMKQYNTFGLECTAKEYMEFKSPKDLEKIRERYLQGGRCYILGGGSNTIFVRSVFEGCVFKVCNKGINILKETDDEVIVQAAAGEIWSDFVRWCCEKNYCGLENLAGIFGTVGASPVQNIGAYGVQVSDFIEWVEYYDLKKGITTKIQAEDCVFAYRTSRWKYSLGTELITSVAFRLKKNFTPNLSYAAVARFIEKEQIKDLTPTLLCDIITQIRNSKLPDPKILGNVGSFFTNPTISNKRAAELKEKDKDLVTFDEGKKTKLSAGYMIEKCGFKGKRSGNVGMHETQALVMVNYGKASGEEIVAYAHRIMFAVFEIYGVKLEIEAHIA